MKIFHNGRQINGRFDSIKAKFKRAVRFTVRWSFISAAGYGLFIAGGLLNPTMSFATEQVEVDVTPKKLEALKDDLVDRLSVCESAGNPNIATVYDNNKAGTLTGADVFSYGVMQWKSGTVKSFVKQRDGKELTTKEAILLALDNDEAKKLAKWTIFETKGGIHHWANCAAKHDLVAEVTIIKRLLN